MLESQGGFNRSKGGSSRLWAASPIWEGFYVNLTSCLALITLESPIKVFQEDIPVHEYIDCPLMCIEF